MPPCFRRGRARACSPNAPTRSLPRHTALAPRPASSKPRLAPETLEQRTLAGCHWLVGDFAGRCDGVVFVFVFVFEERSCARTVQKVIVARADDAIELS